jgi:hypothetical protein
MGAKECTRSEGGVVGHTEVDHQVGGLGHRHSAERGGKGGVVPTSGERRPTHRGGVPGSES